MRYGFVGCVQWIAQYRLLRQYQAARRPLAGTLLVLEVRQAHGIEERV